MRVDNIITEGREAGRSVVITLAYPKTKKERARFSKDYGMNAIYSGKYWTHRQEAKRYWHTLIKTELIRQKIPKQMMDKPVKLIFWWDDRLDCSNHAYMGKMIEDALKGWVIHDDNRKYVKSITHQFWGGGSIRVEVREITLDESVRQE